MKEELRKFIDFLPENYNILDAQVNVEVQLEYFEFSKKVKRKFDFDEILSKKALLLSTDLTIEENTIMYCKSGIFLHNTKRQKVLNNNIFQPFKSGLSIGEDSNGGQGRMWFPVMARPLRACRSLKLII